LAQNNWFNRDFIWSHRFVMQFVDYTHFSLERVT